MRKLFFKIICFIIPIILLILFTEVQYRNIPNDYTYKGEYLKSNGKQIEVLALGGSHNYRGINPDYFDKYCFNAAMVSQPLNFDYFILSKYAKYLENLEYVIIPISYPTLTKPLEEGVEYWRKYRYIHYMGYNKFSLEDIFTLNTYLAISQETGITIIEQLYDYWFHKKDFRDCQQNGWGKWSAEIPANLEELGKRAALRHEDNSFHAKNMQDLNHIIDLCNNQNLQLILITPPATSYYIQSLNSLKWEWINHTCDSIANQYQHVHYLSYLDDTIFNDSFFRDGDHLNTKGAQLFSQKLNDTLNHFDLIMAKEESSVKRKEEYNSY